MCRKGRQNLVLLSLWHADEVERPPKLSRYFIELLRRDLKLAMSFLETKPSQEDRERAVPKALRRFRIGSMATREKRLSETFVSLADTLVRDFDVTDFFYHLVERCTELFDADHVGLVLAEPGGSLQVIATTSEATHLIELLQIQNEEGPSLECFRTGRAVMATDLGTQEARERWPVFAEAASNAGFGSVVALPMRLRDQVIGALNFLRLGPEMMPPEDLSSAQAIADVATISVLQQRAGRDARVVIDQLQGALNSRIVIEQAKGVIAQHRSADMEQAFALLRGFSRDNNLLMTDVARRIVQGDIDLNILTKTQWP